MRISILCWGREVSGLSTLISLVKMWGKIISICAKRWSSPHLAHHPINMSLVSVLPKSTPLNSYVLFWTFLAWAGPPRRRSCFWSALANPTSRYVSSCTLRLFAWGVSYVFRPSHNHAHTHTLRYAHTRTKKKMYTCIYTYSRPNIPCVFPHMRLCWNLPTGTEGYLK